ncbi:MAG: chromosome segregation protein SMC [Oscillospiraceae bacterium]|nr:chromosome segregation protein SMC [Oscillospiraceae bacterium]
MYLKALEIQGFKSFPDKTVLDFGEDITAIVGPNGSGKSNISDAISWVMGEQSARSLRGNKMEDVIFGGTAKRNPVGFAQVSLVLDNSAKIFPDVDSSEVMVTRRYYRSGESEYYINKQSVRLRDINELFMDTGLGREGYSMIGQGRIDEILSIRSADRREIFEEAAGISKFRHRKEEAERRLQRTEENLVRINDKISELELQVVPLREQAETAKKYLRLRDELRILEISVWMERLGEIKTLKSKLQADFSAAKTRQEEAQKQLDALYEENEEFSRKMQENDTEQERVRQEAGAFELQAKDEENAAALLRTEIQHKRESIGEINEELTRQEGRSRNTQEEIENQKGKLSELEEQTAGLERELDELRVKAEKAAASVGSAEDEVRALQAKEALAADAAAKGRERLSALSAGMEQMEERQRTVQKELETAGTQLGAVQRDVKAARRALEDAEEEANAAANMIRGHQLRMEGREKREKAAADAKLQLTMELNNLDSRIRLLTEMEKEYEGFSKAVREVMRAAQRNTLRGIHGPVAGLMKTDAKYAVAIETALGAGMQNIVVDREEDAKGAIQYLKQRDGGRATFLPLTAMRGGELQEKGVEKEFGFVGIASRLITYAPGYNNVFRNLLGYTVVMEDLDCGIAVARKYGNRFRIVTLDGQVINRGGSMTGGSVSKSAGMLSRASELDALKGKKKEFSARLSQAQREYDEAVRDLRVAQYELQAAEGQKRIAEDAVLRLRGEVKQHEALLDGAKSGAENLAGERDALAERIEDQRKQQKTVRLETEKKEREAAEIRRAVGEKMAGQTDLQAYSNRLSEEMFQRKEALAGRRAERTAALDSLSRLEQTARDLEGDRKQRRQRIAEYRDAIETAEQEIGQKTGEAASLRLRAQGCQERLRALQDAKLRLEQERTAMGQRLKDCNDAVLDAEREAGRLEQKLNTGDMEEKQILDKLWESYELSHSAAMEQRIELESTAKANRRIGELKREINGLGTVNVGAIEQFKVVNERYTYLTGQRDDVEQAKTELKGIIDGITREMTAIFAEQFQMINTAFQETFLHLFGGGQASLELEDLDDILNCGIEIKVQPPGKTLKTLSLLSGGEKAFVAIALYFAILKVHPTPFCVMDEIEAALDEANVVRVARYMRSISDKTQFIVITHRRGTMEEADILYGVTMQEKGVSKMLRINMNDVAEELNIP